MKRMLIIPLLMLVGCASNHMGGFGHSGVSRIDHAKIVKKLHNKVDVRLLMGEPVYDGPFRKTFPARELPEECPRGSTSHHYLSHYETIGPLGKEWKVRQADVIHFDEQGVVCAVSSRACPANNEWDRCYEDVENGIERPYRY